MARMGRRWIACLLALAMLAGCANAPRTPNPSDQEVTRWAGRLSVRVDGDPANSFAAGFELKGSAQSGELSLYAPFGATIAQLAWTPDDARLRASGTESSFPSLGALVKHATGTELPVSSIFSWLAGQNTNDSGWQADLGELGRGRLVARRTTPLPSVELRLVLE